MTPHRLLSLIAVRLLVGASAPTNTQIDSIQRRRVVVVVIVIVVVLVIVVIIIIDVVVFHVITVAAGVCYD